MLYRVYSQSIIPIADKIREKKHQSNLMTLAQMAEELDEMGLEFNVCRTEDCTAEDWERPEEYPDPTVIDRADFDGVYLTYDLRKTRGYGWIGIFAANAVSNTPVYIERGHIEDNAFVVDQQETITSASSSSGGYFRQDLDESAGMVQLWRVRSDNRIVRCAFCPNTATNTQNLMNNIQPCVERYGRLPNATNLSSSIDTRYNYFCWATRWLYRDDVCDVVKVTTMSGAYSNARNLRIVKFDGWNTSNVTTFASCFLHCWSLKTIPLDHLSVTEKTTALNSMFEHCRVLDHVDISHFNIDKVTTMASMFSNCRSLKDLEMSNFEGIGKLTNTSYMFSTCSNLQDVNRNIRNLNVTNVTNMSQMFANCVKMQFLDLSNWTVESVTNLSSFCDYCYALAVCDLSGWDVHAVTRTDAMFRDNWSLKKCNLRGWHLLAVTNAANMFATCWNLENPILPDEWDISELTTAASMFNGCYSIKEISLPWGGSNNILTTVASMFSNCWSLKKLSMPNMHFTVAVKLESFLNNCYSLKNLDISGWIISRIDSISSFFANCRSLEEIDLTDWTVTSGAMAAKNTVNSVFNCLYNCKSIKVNFPLSIVTSGSMSTMITTDTPLRYLDLSAWDLHLSTNITVPNSPMLVDYYPPILPAVNHSYADAVCLSRESLLRIIDRLPRASAARTLTLGQSNKLKLTAEEIAVATGKGWTVA